MRENSCMSIRISLKFVSKSPIDNISALVSVMAWRRTGDKPLPEPMLTQFPDAYMNSDGKNLIIKINGTSTAWTRRSENDNTPQPLDQWTNSPFIGQQVGNCKSFTLTHYLADLFAMHRGPRSISLCIQHHIQLTSLSFQVSRPSHS